MIRLLAGLLLATPAFAQNLERPDLRVKVAPFDLQTRALSFPSGLTVILQNDKKAAYVSVVSVSTGGTNNDEAGKHGAAYLAEMLFYEADDGSGPVRNRLYAEGIEYAAQTIQDWTTFRTTGTMEALPTMLAVEGLRLNDPLAGVTDEHLDQAKTIVGMWPYYRDPQTFNQAWDTMVDNLYPEGHPWAELDPLAWKTEYKGVSLKDVGALEEKAWIPSETTIVVSGPIDFDETIKQLFASLPPQVMHPDATEENLKQFFKRDVVNPDPENPDHVTYWLADPETDELIDLEYEEVVRIKPPEEAIEPFPRSKKYKGDVLHVEGLVDTPMAVVGWALAGSWVGQDAVKSLAASAIGTAGGGDWAAQYDIAKNPGGGALAGCAGFVARDAGHVVCSATARDTKVNAEELADRLMAPASEFWNPQATMLHDLATNGGRQILLGSMIHQLEHHGNLTAGLAAQTALNAHFSGDPTYFSQHLNNVMQVDKTELRPWVQAWMQESRAVQVVVDPIPKDKWLQIQPQGAYHSALLGHAIPESDEIPTNEEIAATYQALDLSKATTKTLGNGLKVIVLPHGSMPIATVDLVSVGGAATERGLDTLSALSMQGLYDDIYSNPAAPKNELLPYNIGAEHVASSSADLTHEGFAVPRDNLDGGLYLLRRNDMARKVKLIGKSNWWKSTKLTLPRTWDQRSWWAQQARMKRILPDHPVIWHMTQEDARRLKDIETSAIADYQDKKFNPKNSILVITGDIDPDEAMSLAEKYWGDWKRDASGTPPAMPPRPEPKGPATLFYDADGADFTVVSAACPLPAPTAEMSAGQQVVGSALEEAFTQKLVENGAPAVAAVASHREGGGVSWIELTAVLPHGLGNNAVKAVKATLALPEEGGLDADRIQQHKLRIAGTSWGTLSNTRVVAQLAGEAFALPYKGSDWYTKFGDALVAVDGDGIKKATEGCAANAVITIEAPSAEFASFESDYEAKRIDWQEKSDKQLETWDKKAYKRRLKQRAKGK